MYNNFYRISAIFYIAMTIEIGFFLEKKINSCEIFDEPKFSEITDIIAKNRY